MAIDTYANLQAAIGRWLRRSDLSTDIPNFISLAEVSINAKLRNPKMRATVSFPITGELVNLPTDYLTAISLRLTTGTGSELNPITEEQAQEWKSTPSVIPAEPRGYNVRGSQMEFTPVPNQTYQSQLSYYIKVPALSDVNTTNWLLTSYPNVYLYGALLQSAPFLRADDRVALWSGAFDAALDDVRSGNRLTQTPTLGVDIGLRPRRNTFNIISGDFQ